MRGWSIAGAVLILSLVAVAQEPADKDFEQQMRLLEGKFERYVTNAAGVRFHIVKEVAGDQSTVMIYDDQGRVVDGHRSVFSVAKQGPVHVFTYQDLEVLAGPQKGRIDKGPYSYLYRVEGDTITEAWGLLESDKTPPRMFQWTRVKE